MCCSPWSCKESDTTEQLNDNKLFKYRVPTMDYQGWPREGVVYHLESSWQLCKVGVNKPTKRSEAQTLQLTQSHPQHQSQSLIPHPDDLLSFRQPSVRHSAKHSGGTQRGLVLPISYSATYYHIFFPFFLFFFFFCLWKAILQLGRPHADSFFFFFWSFVILTASLKKGKRKNQYSIHQSCHSYFRNNSNTSGAS